MFRPVKGFTLIEALVVMAIAAILLAVAVPAWSHARAAANAGAVRARLATSLLDAVRHSSIAGTEVVICPASSSGLCSGSTNWDSGWIAFADINGSRAPDPNETRLSGGDALPDDVHLRTTTGRTRLVFQPNGGNAGSNVTFTLCDSRGPRSATTLVLSNAGNLRPGQPTAAAAWNCVYGQ
ncbi:GspH/FimT family protein [Lysobacter sp. Root494]|uniref:GspH/FimT family protein n=1 Tax=Lysobacter sp. Root494 TaxID=1736549 RepID=UPI00138F6341|nr:GspH/FimT family protein [Lysobacter sp. Root494]